MIISRIFLMPFSDTDNSPIQNAKFLRCRKLFAVANRCNNRSNKESACLQIWDKSKKKKGETRLEYSKKKLMWKLMPMIIININHNNNNNHTITSSKRNRSLDLQYLLFFLYKGEQEFHDNLKVLFTDPTNILGFFLIG